MTFIMELTQHNDIYALIAKNLAGLADSSEIEKLNEWINSSESNNKYFEQLKNIWDTSDRQLDPKTINTSEALKSVFARIPHISQRKSLWRYWQKIAAILILPMAIGTFIWGYLNSAKRTGSSAELIYNNVYAPYGTRSSLFLDDSTLVWLNSGSHLKFPVKFNSNERTVYLNGEAYFEVKSDATKPFIVKTSTLQVKATGTKFNVQCYTSRILTEVTLASGKVIVNETGTNKHSRAVYVLHPDQHLGYNKLTKQNKIIDGDSYKYIAWKDGKLIFRNEPLRQVLDQIGLMFNVDIELQGRELQNYRYHATFEDESLEEILKLLKISAPINYTEIERNPLPDGSFPKKKVIIYPVNQEIIKNLTNN